MLKHSDLFHIPYYQKAAFTGSLGGMRFCIEKAGEKDAPVLRVWIFPGPFCFAKTDDSQKESVTFDFTEDGLAQAADFLNSQYETRIDYWDKHRRLIP